MKIEFKRLPEVSKAEIIDLMNNDLVRNHMPLLTEKFDDKICEKFIFAKEELWAEYGYGPWAFVFKNIFVGWGGLQPEKGDADLALVLHPKYWGLGKYLYKQIVECAFDKMKLKSITVLLPPSRTRIKGFLSLGFEKECEIKINGKEFVKYRLTNNSDNNF